MAWNPRLGFLDLELDLFYYRNLECKYVSICLPFVLFLELVRHVSPSSSASASTPDMHKVPVLRRRPLPAPVSITPHYRIRSCTSISSSGSATAHSFITCTYTFYTTPLPTRTYALYTTLLPTSTHHRLPTLLFFPPRPPPAHSPDLALHSFPLSLHIIHTFILLSIYHPHGPFRVHYISFISHIYTTESWIPRALYIDLRMLYVCGLLYMYSLLLYTNIIPATFRWRGLDAARLIFGSEKVVPIGLFYNHFYGNTSRGHINGQVLKNRNHLFLQHPLYHHVVLYLHCTNACNRFL